MKHRAYLVLIPLLLLCLIACGKTDAEPAQSADTPSMNAKVELLGRDGASLPYLSALRWSNDGQLAADGMLMFYTVPEYLSEIAEQIPTVDLGDNPKILATASKGVEIEGGETVSVYGEDFAPMAENITLPELTARGKTEWAGRTVYLCFTVTFRTALDAERTAGTSSGYFVKVVF